MADAPIETMPQFIIPRHEFTDGRDIDLVCGVGEIAVANPFMAAKILEPFREATEFQEEARIQSMIVGNKNQTDYVRNAFVLTTAMMFNKQLDGRVRFDDGSSDHSVLTARTIENVSGGKVYDNQERILRLQMFLKRCVSWSEQTTPQSVLSLPAHQREMAPGGRVVLL